MKYTLSFTTEELHTLIELTKNRARSVRDLVQEPSQKIYRKYWEKQYEEAAALNNKLRDCALGKLNS